jgi:MFS family permease
VEAQAPEGREVRCVSRFWNWFLTSGWHWVWLSAQIIAVLVALIQGVFLAVNWSRRLRNWWALQSHKRTVRRLPELRADLERINEPVDIQHEQIIFFNVVIVVLTLLAGGALSGTFYVYAYFYSTQMHEGKPVSIAFMAMAVVLLIFAVAIAWWGAYHYSGLRDKARQLRRKQTEQAIAAMEKRLKRDLPIPVAPPKASA